MLAGGGKWNSAPIRPLKPGAAKLPIGLEQGDGEHALEPPTGAIPPDCVARFGLGEFAWVALVKGADDQPRHDHGQQDRQTGLGGADSALTPAEDDRRQR